MCDIVQLWNDNKLLTCLGTVWHCGIIFRTILDCRNGNMQYATHTLVLEDYFVNTGLLFNNRNNNLVIFCSDCMVFYCGNMVLVYKQVGILLGNSGDLILGNMAHFLRLYMGL